MLNLLLVLAAACPQTRVYVPDNAANTGPLNSAPLGAQGPTGGWQNLRTQILVPGSALPSGGSVIRELGLAGGADGFYSYSLLEVRLGHASGTPFGATFAANSQDLQSVLRRASTRLDVRRDAFFDLGLQSSFHHDGRRDLVVDIVIQGAVFQGATPGTRRSSTLPTVYALDYDVAQPAPSGFGPYLAGAKLALTLAESNEPRLVGAGCAKADGRSPVLGSSGRLARGSSFTAQCLDATPNAAVMLALGGSDTTWGSLQLPYDLATLGAAGCIWRTDVVLALLLPTDALGSAHLAIPIGNQPGLLGRRVLCQVLAIAPLANAAGLAVTPALVGTIQ